MKLSIIIPCYNVSQYIQKCIEDIFANDVKDSEIIFVDDGSTDMGGGGIADYFEQPFNGEYADFTYKKARVKIIWQKNAGVSAARNRGLEEASGQYILFMDPDDSVSKDWFSAVWDLVESQNFPDIIILGFEHIQLDAREGEERRWGVLPIEEYNICSNFECVQTLFPRFLGYSVSNIKKWAGGEKLGSQLEFGSVWRNAYRRQFLLDNDIRFSTKIKLNEDSMFNARCCIHAETVVGRMAAYYCYMSRPLGALRTRMDAQRNVAGFIENKLELARERKELVEEIKERGFECSICEMAGSCVMSVLEIIAKCPLMAWGTVKKYIYHETVVQSVKAMPYIGMMKFDMPLWALKHHMALPLFVVANIAKKVGISLNP